MKIKFNIISYMSTNEQPKNCIDKKNKLTTLEKLTMFQKKKPKSNLIYWVITTKPFLAYWEVKEHFWCMLHLQNNRISNPIYLPLYYNESSGELLKLSLQLIDLHIWQQVNNIAYCSSHLGTIYLDTCNIPKIGKYIYEEIV